MPVSLLKISFFVGDEVCRGVAFDAKTGDESQILRFLKDKLETPYVVSYFFNRLLDCFVSLLRGSGQNVGRGDGGAERTSWSIADFLNGINAALRTRWDFAVFGEFDVGRQIVWEIDFISSFQILFQSELVRCGINLAEVVDTSIHRAGASCLDEIGGAGYKNPDTEKG